MSVSALIRQFTRLEQRTGGGRRAAWRARPIPGDREGRGRAERMAATFEREHVASVDGATVEGAEVPVAAHLVATRALDLELAAARVERASERPHVVREAHVVATKAEPIGAIEEAPAVDSDGDGGPDSFDDLAHGLALPRVVGGHEQRMDDPVFGHRWARNDQSA